VYLTENFLTSYISKTYAVYKLVRVCCFFSRVYIQGLESEVSTIASSDFAGRMLVATVSVMHTNP